MKHAQALIMKMIETFGETEVYAMAKRLNRKPRESLTDNQRAFLLAIHLYLIDQSETTRSIPVQSKKRRAA